MLILVMPQQRHSLTYTDVMFWRNNNLLTWQCTCWHHTW